MAYALQYVVGIILAALHYKYELENARNAWDIPPAMNAHRDEQIRRL
jgi:prolipoprotein diacylglyceryltransferase